MNSPSTWICNVLIFTLTYSPTLTPSFSRWYLPQTISQMSTDNTAL